MVPAILTQISEHHAFISRLDSTKLDWARVPDYVRLRLRLRLGLRLSTRLRLGLRLKPKTKTETKTKPSLLSKAFPCPQDGSPDQAATTRADDDAVHLMGSWILAFWPRAPLGVRVPEGADFAPRFRRLRQSFRGEAHPPRGRRHRRGPLSALCRVGSGKVVQPLPL